MLYLEMLAEAPNTPTLAHCGPALSGAATLVQVRDKRLPDAIPLHMLLLQPTLHPPPQRRTYQRKR